MTCLWLITIGPKQAVPPGQIKAKITIEFFYQYGMMDTVHFWCDNEESDQPVDASGKSDITMVEHAGDVEEHLENDHGDGRDSKKSDRSHFYAHG